ncbi:DUF1269 domain-containing protein [Microbacterium sp. M3]|uniref:DUF1269 domain-containing protein n=1 Tax=Microbacterium arthrosphaerae TaxID=792652 RepID=A0ABU4H1N6_9MICO|nr:MULTISPECIES: DUF1269 domain-containing protein [Microbacterium]MDW4573238.1 DUF1269 domain-containing protein [Microbacterium arthrosphaerae]MDW7607093.1 DUF1269 domain-containing protein [Microbacterium sp. M3]
MGTKNLALVVGSYDDTASASDDYQALRSGQDAGGYEIIGAVVLVRDDDGKVQVKEHGDKSVGRGTAWGAGAGAVVGLFAPPLLAATAVGAGIGAILGKIKKNREEKQFGVDVDEYLAPGTSAVVAVVDDRWADNVEKALGRADKRISKAIDSDDYEKLREAIEKSADDVVEQINA